MKKLLVILSIALLLFTSVSCDIYQNPSALVENTEGPGSADLDTDLHSTLWYQLTASWSSYVKSDTLLRTSTPPLSSVGRTAVSSRIAIPSPQEGSPFISPTKNSLPKERAIIVKYKQGYSLQEKSIKQSFSMKNIQSSKLYTEGLKFDRFVVDENEYESIPDLLNQLQNTEGVEYASEEVQYRICSYPNDPQYWKQWNMHMLNMPAVWEVTTGDESVIVAVLDTGLYPNIPDLRSTKVKQGYNFIANSIDFTDDHGHGTHVTGTIAQATNNEIGVTGIAPDVTILPIKVLDNEGNGSDAQVAQGILFAVNNGAHIINLSLGGDEESQLLKDACSYALARDVLIIAAAGNEGTETVLNPASYETVLSVGAINDSKKRAWYSNWGEGLDVMAPGGDHKSTLTNTLGEEFMALIYQQAIIVEDGKPEILLLGAEGTSMATPHVAGLAALIKSKNPNLSAVQIREIIQSTADGPSDGEDSNEFKEYYGYGTINPVRALSITPYTKSKSVETSIALVPSRKHRWRISAAESTVKASLQYIDDSTKISLFLEKSDGTELQKGLASKDAVTLEYDLKKEDAGELWLTVTVEEVNAL